VPCQDLSLPDLPGFEILSVQSSEVFNYSSVNIPSIQPPVSGLNFCNVSLALTHPRALDTVLVQIWLPIGNWNGRWQSTGGGGLAAGHFDAYLAPVVAAGYATASTDAGLTLNNTINPQTGAWAIHNNGSLNTALIENFAYRSIHEMTLLGKAATVEFYGCPARYSYYGGCSTGGRQGYFVAHLYPEDFDGIMANSPAINTPQISPADFWPSVVMTNIVAPTQCVFSAYQNATIAACDPLDGVTDGLISDISKCYFDPSTLVGSTATCNGESYSIPIKSRNSCC
jgi:feruloyl esterase